jgi:hypothetical protein
MSFRIPGNNSFTMEPSLFCSAGLRRCSRDPPGLVAGASSSRLFYGSGIYSDHPETDQNIPHAHRH